VILIKLLILGSDILGISLAFMSSLVLLFLF